MELALLREGVVDLAAEGDGFAAAASVQGLLSGVLGSRVLRRGGVGGGIVRGSQASRSAGTTTGRGGAGWTAPALQLPALAEADAAALRTARSATPPPCARPASLL